MPGIRSAGISTNIPLRGEPIMTDFEVRGSHAGASATTSNSDLRVRFDTATADYFRAMGMHLVRGKPLSGSPEPAPVKDAVVNERFVQDFLQGADPIGLRIAVFGQETEVSGVVADTYVWSPHVNPSPEIFVHAFQNDFWRGR
ncbi:MAG: ABC transporter permease [Acidobacteriota bacterium]